MADEVQATPVPAAPQSPFEYIRGKYATFPNETVIESFKQQVPGGLLRFFELPDGKRACLLRALSPLELAAVQAEIAKYDPAKQQFEMQVLVASKCLLWSSFGSVPKLTENEIRTGSAGLPSTLQAVIFDLSDFIDPAIIDRLVIDL